MAVLTSSQQTFVDITDQRKLSAYLTSNLPKTQVENPNVLPHTCEPSWAKTALKLTPVIFLDQTPVSLGASGLTITWKRKDGAGSESALTAGESVSGGILTVSQDKLVSASSGMLTYICYISYLDTETQNTVNITADLTFTLVKNAENARLADVTADVYAFKYNTSGSLVGATQATLNAQVQGVEILGWQYKKSDGTWADYPTTSDNADITSATLIVKPTHAVFFNDVATIKLLTDDDAVFDVITITRMRDGAAGNGIKTITEYYLASAQSSGVTTSTAGWTTTPQTTTTTNKYLWNYRKIAYTNGSSTDTTPAIISTHGATGAAGNGISSITQYYLATSAASGVTTATEGWSTTPAATTTTNKYLWNYTKFTYTNGTSTNTTPAIIGTHGATGATGSGGLSVILGNEAQSIACTNGGLVQAAVDVEIPFVGYVGITQTACTCAVGTLPSGVTTKSNTAATASAAGKLVLTFAANATLGSASTMNGSIPLTFTISGKTVTKTFSWSKSNKGNTGAAGVNAVVFSVYAPNGSVFQNQTGTLLLDTAAYDGSTVISSGATYQWAKYTSGTWQNISSATGKSLTINGSDVVNVQSYRCTMTYKSKTYQDVITIEDKSDTYVSEMLAIGGFSFKNNLGGKAVYVIVRTNNKEVDPLLGPISTTAPSSPKTEDYYYKVDHSAKSVTLMKYSGSAWAEAAEKQSLTYNWYMQDKDGNAVDTFERTGKVIYLHADDVDSLCTLQCDVTK